LLDRRQLVLPVDQAAALLERFARDRLSLILGEHQRERVRCRQAVEIDVQQATVAVADPEERHDHAASQHLVDDADRLQRLKGSSVDDDGSGEAGRTYNLNPDAFIDCRGPQETCKTCSVSSSQGRCSPVAAPTMPRSEAA
jgi:hypothetical protein